MTTIDATHEKLVLTVRGFDVVLALKHTLEIPLEHVLGAEVGIADELRRRLWHSLKLPGSRIPGVITAGSYWTHEGWMFWDVHGSGEHAITIAIAHEKYDRVVVDVEDPASAVAAIRTALAARA
jgi:hypothetical protein